MCAKLHDGAKHVNIEEFPMNEFGFAMEFGFTNFSLQ